MRQRKTATPAHLDARRLAALERRVAAAEADVHDRIVTRSVKEGRITESEAPAYRRLFQRDAVAAKALLDARPAKSRELSDDDYRAGVAGRLNLDPGSVV